MLEIVKNSVKSTIQKVTDVLKSEHPPVQLAKTLNLEEIIEDSTIPSKILISYINKKSFILKNLMLLFLKLLILLEKLLIILGTNKTI